jgi:hypothetical protein
MARYALRPLGWDATASGSGRLEVRGAAGAFTSSVVAGPIYAKSRAKPTNAKAVFFKNAPTEYGCSNELRLSYRRNELVNG